MRSTRRRTAPEGIGGPSSTTTPPASNPSAAAGTESERRFAFADTHRMLFQRIGIFTALPLVGLDRLSLQKRLDDIGRSKAITPEPAK